MQYARIVGGFVVDVTPDRPVVGAHESAMILPCPDAAVVGWVVLGGEVVAPAEPVDPATDPLTVAHSYLLADAKSVDELRTALAVILGL